MLEVVGFTKRFGDTLAVDNLSFNVPSGVCFGLLGPNGAGKTTTISMLAGTIEPDAGSASIDGQPLITSNRSVRRRIGYVPQELAVYDDLTTRANLEFFGALYGMYGDETKRAVARVLDIVGLSERSEDQVKTFSGGMKRRLNIAIGLLHDPDLIILDEPTVGVDPQTRNAIFDSLAHLREEQKTILYTTHYMEEVERLCQEVAIIDQGKIVASGGLSELKQTSQRMKEVTIHFTEEPPDLGLEELPGVISANRNCSTVTVDLEDLDESLTRVLSQCKTRGASVKSIQSHIPSLEHIFLEVTGRSLRD